MMPGNEIFSYAARRDNVGVFLKISQDLLNIHHRKFELLLREEKRGTNKIKIPKKYYNLLFLKKLYLKRASTKSEIPLLLNFLLIFAL
jgi:hypothetical protein